MKCPEKKQILIIGAIGGLCVLFVVLGYFPLSRKIKASKAEKAQAELARIETLKQIDEIPELKSQIAAMSERVGDFEAKVPQNRAFADFWQEITDVMNEYQLTDRLVRPGVEVQGETVSCIPLDLECSGRFSQVFEFLRALDKFEREIRIEQVKIVNDSNCTGDIKLNALAKIYYRHSN